ncbi:MAG: type II toxin-antitoxin system HicB family antitoxin [Minisyncoccia bacterium]|jgi:predicted RNase H-like HicB family nuclease
MLTEFLSKKLKQARYKRLKDGSYFGEISGVRGVWANARTLVACRVELREVLEDWLLLKVQSREVVPGFQIKTDRRSLVKNG